jgi:signal transduction histidine kinase/ActR/RegA family two-component response regulator
VNAAAREAREQRVVVLAPRGRDALVAKEILRNARVNSDICVDLNELVTELQQGAEVAVVAEEAVNTADTRELANWVASQPAWSDFPFVLLTKHGGGVERNPAAARLTGILRNVTFLERPFHPTTLISAVQAGLYGRRRQHEFRRLNEELEIRVQERTAELAAANRQLLSQIEERERVESTLRQMQRLEAVGQLTAGVAHDFNNLLTVVLGNLGFLEREFAAAGIDGKMRQRLHHMRMAAERGAKLTDQLLSFSRRQRLEPRSVDINATIRSMSELLHSTIGSRIYIETQLSETMWPALVDPTQLELAVLNLAINARDAMEGSGTLTIRSGNVKLGPPLRAEEPAAGEYVMISVADSGSGMTEAVRARAFEPFFTTKEVGRGSGLGLSQVLGFAKQSGGGIRIDTRVNEGTAIYIYLPRAETEAERIMRPQIVARDAQPCRILLVDDDAAVREITASILTDAGHGVIEAGSGGAALELLERESDIDLVLVDFAMPGMNGAELAQLVRARRPTLPILFVTGFADRAALAGVSDADVIGKPFLNDELINKVRDALDRRGARNVVRLRR